MRRWVRGAVLAAAATATGLAAAQGGEPKTAAPASAAATQGWPALAARYRVAVRMRGQPEQVQTWQLERSADRIALVRGSVEDLWLRDGRGAIALQRVLRDDRTVIEYSPGELKTLEVDVDWNALATLFDPARLGSGTPAARGAVQRHVGRIGDERIMLLWDATLQLPRQLVREGPRGRVRYDLLATRADGASWPAAGAGIDDFRRLDAADFGDMEYDPVVRKAMAIDVRTGWRAAHEH